MNWPWSELGLPGPAELSEVRRAYAERLKVTHPEEDPEGFQRLHEAYQQARRLARKGGGGAVGQQTATQPQEQQAQQEGPGWDRRGSAAPEGVGEDEAEQPDWDFEAIFSQQAAQRAAERERHAQERRDAYFTKHDPAALEEREQLEEQWSRIDRALMTVEELHASGAPLYVWTSFLNSSAFFSVKGDEDFVVGLEGFLRHTPDLDGQVKVELIKAFNLRQTDVPSLWLGLQELLVEFAPSERESRAPRQEKGWKRIWSMGRIKTWTKGQRMAWWIVMAASVSAVVLLIVLGVLSDIRNDRAQALEQDRLCGYMEEDFGRAVGSQWKGRANYEDLYAPWDEPDLTFMAWPDGERDLAAGQRGYTTNYSSVMVTKALKGFSKEQGWELDLIQEGGCDGVMGAYGTSPGGYVLRPPLTGGGEGVAALGRLLEELAEERWYQAFPPSFQLILAYHELTYFTYSSDADGPFDAEAVRYYYENRAGAALCAFLVEESGLAREDFGGGGYVLEPRGPVELDGKSYFLVSGLDRVGETVRQYLFDGIQLVSLPAEEYSPDLKMYQIGGDRFNSTWAEMPSYIWISRK